MVDIFYPEISESTQHVASYFDNTPADTSSVLYKEFAEGARFGIDKLGSLGGYIQSQIYDDTLITAEEYRASKYFREGLDVPSEGIKESIAESLAEAYDRRFQRDLTLSRAKSGFGISSARFGAGLVGSVFDPVNIGLALAAPIAIGLNATARAAAIRATTGITQKYGVTAGRVASGAGEGALGAALFEPIAIAGSRIEQDPNYGAFETFVNLTAGAILSGAVTGVGGKFSDTFRRAKPETVVQSMRVATAQLSEGVPVRVESIIDTDPVIGPSEKVKNRVLETQRTSRNLNTSRPKAIEVPPSLKRAYKIDKNTKQTKLPLTITQFVKRNGKIDTASVLQGELKDRLDVAAFGVRKKGGVSIDDMALKAQEEGFFPDKPDPYIDRVTPEDLVDALERDSGPGEKVFSSFDEDAKEYLSAIELDERVYDLGIEPKGMTDEELFEEIQIRENALTDEQAIELERSKGPGITRQQLDEEIARVEEQTQQGGDLEEFYHPQEEIDMLAKEYEMRMRTEDSRISSFDKEIEMLEKQVQALRNNDVISEEDLAELAEWDSVISRSDEMSGVAEAGAYCVMRSRNV